MCAENEAVSADRHLKRKDLFRGLANLFCIVEMANLFCIVEMDIVEHRD